MSDIDNPILIELALVLAIATGLHVALGPIIARLVEAIKPTGLVKPNYAGLFAVALSGVVGAILGLMAYLAPHVDSADWRYIVYGAIAGIIGPGSGAVTSAQVRNGIEASKDARSTKVETTQVAIDRDAGDQIAAVQVTKAVSPDPVDFVKYAADFGDTGEGLRESTGEDTPYNWWLDDVKKAEKQIGADLVETMTDDPDAGSIPLRARQIGGTVVY